MGLTFRPKPAMIGRVVGGQIVQKDNWPDKAQTEMSALYPAFFCEKEECIMDFLNGTIKSIYLKYLSAAFGSAMITSIYSIVDTAMVGQYQGPSGTAALAVVAPLWNIIYSLGLLMGIGALSFSVQSEGLITAGQGMKTNISPSQSLAPLPYPCWRGWGFCFWISLFCCFSGQTARCFLLRRVICCQSNSCSLCSYSIRCWPHF